MLLMYHNSMLVSSSYYGKRQAARQERQGAQPTVEKKQENFLDRLFNTEEQEKLAKEEAAAYKLESELKESTRENIRRADVSADTFNGSEFLAGRFENIVNESIERARELGLKKIKVVADISRRFALKAEELKREYDNYMDHERSREHWGNIGAESAYASEATIKEVNSAYQRAARASEKSKNRGITIMKDMVALTNKVRDINTGH